MSAVSESIHTREKPRDLSDFALLSIAAAIATILLKSGAYWLTGSVGLLSDAAESLVNLVAAIVAFIALKVAIRPPDKNHHYGHSKAEYFSASAEGMMIFVAAAGIIITSVERFLHPRELENVGIGLVISVIASVLNGTVAWVLMRAGRKHRSMTLVADSKHLMTDVWTSVGVIAGVGLVWMTGWTRLDAIVAFAVGINILWTGWRLIKDSTDGLMDISLPKEENAAIRKVLEEFDPGVVDFHAIRTRESGTRRFFQAHMLVPGAWSVQAAHDRCEDVTAELLQLMPELSITFHIEPIEDPRSYDDIDI